MMTRRPEGGKAASRPPSLSPGHPCYGCGKQALGQAFINIGNTEEGKEVIAIYSHNGYQWAKSEDYDSERAAQEMIQSLNSAG